MAAILIENQASAVKHTSKANLAQIIERFIVKQVGALLNAQISNMKNKGFTLMEILIVIAMLGILATIIFGSYLSSLKKGRDSRRKQDLEMVARALELYYSEQGHYPDSWEVSFGGSLVVPESNPQAFYMKQLPNDPVDSYQYDYVVDTTDNQSYQLYACLENDLDPDYNSNDYSGTDCGSSCSPCHYGIASPNSVP